MKFKFNDDSLNAAFETLGFEYADMLQLMSDTAKGVQEVSKREAEDAIRTMMFSVLELDPANLDNKKLFKRAMKKNKDRMFEVIEDVVEDMLIQGWGEDPFFNQYVETKNLADGDKNEFWTEEEITLAVAEVSGDHHDVLVQRLGEGQSYSVKTSTYGAAVGTDIRLFLTGRKDWSVLVNAIYKAFDKKVKDTVYHEVINVGDKLPAVSMFNKAFPLDAAHKSEFDQLLSDVSAANDNCEVVIMGDSVTLKKLGKLTEIDWISDKAKDSLHDTGKLGFYEGTGLVEIPARLIKEGGVLKRMGETNRLLVFPVSMDKFVKFINVGDAEILEITEQGARNDDSMKFEYQETLGVGIQVGKYFGAVKVTA